MPTESDVRKLYDFYVEFTRYDEGQVVAYHVIVNTSTDEADVIRKAELQFKADFPEAVLSEKYGFPVGELPEGFDAKKWFWRNRTNFSHEVIY